MTSVDLEDKPSERIGSQFDISRFNREHVKCMFLPETNSSYSAKIFALRVFTTNLFLFPTLGTSSGGGGYQARGRGGGGGGSSRGGGGSYGNQQDGGTKKRKPPTCSLCHTEGRQAYEWLRYNADQEQIN